MPGSSFGTKFRLTSFGESHGELIGAVIDGCPAGLFIDEDFINSELQRRRPGQSKITSQRKEDDQVRIVSGVSEGLSTGAPITALIYNQDKKSADYDHLKVNYRPSHADFTYDKKYGVRDHKGGGRSSARETANRVVAGAIAKLLLKRYGITIQAYVSQVGNLSIEKTYDQLDLNKAEENIVRCPDPKLAEKMISLINDVRKMGDTVGGVITCVVSKVPVGLGEPVFDKLHADLAKAVISINACKGFEYGSGFAAATMKGSEHNDSFVKRDGVIQTESNNSGGIQGGISNGMDIYFKAVFKPVSTIMSSQESVNSSGEKVVVEGKGRHDPCIVPRAVPVVEAMAAITIADHLLRSKTDRVE